MSPSTFSDEQHDDSDAEDEGLDDNPSRTTPGSANPPHMEDDRTAGITNCATYIVVQVCLHIRLVTVNCQAAGFEDVAAKQTGEIGIHILFCNVCQKRKEEYGL